MNGYSIHSMADDLDDVPGPRERGGSPALPTTWRPIRTRLVVYPVAVVVLVCMSVIAALLPSQGTAPWHLGDRILFASVGAVVAVAMHLLARPRVIARRDGLTVVNMVRTRHLDWAQIVGISLRPGDPWALLDLDDGDVFAVMGIQSSGGADADRAVAQLAALVERFSRTERDD